MASGSSELASWRFLSPSWEQARSKTKKVAPGIPRPTKRAGKLACPDQRGKSYLGIRLSGRRGIRAAFGNADWTGNRRRRVLKRVNGAFDGKWLSHAWKALLAKMEGLLWPSACI